MSKKLDSVGAIAAAPSKLGESQSMHISVEKIENGFVTRTSCYGGDGDYKSTEVYSPQAPKLSPPQEPRARSVGTLSAAMRSLK